MIPSFKAYFRKSRHCLSETYQEEPSYWRTLRYVTESGCQHSHLRRILHIDWITVPTEYALPFIPCEETCLQMHVLTELYKSDKNNSEVGMFLNEPAEAVSTLMK